MTAWEKNWPRGPEQERGSNVNVKIFLWEHAGTWVSSRKLEPQTALNFGPNFPSSASASEEENKQGPFPSLSMSWARSRTNLRMALMALLPIRFSSTTAHSTRNRLPVVPVPTSKHQVNLIATTRAWLSMITVVGLPLMLGVNHVNLKSVLVRQRRRQVNFWNFWQRFCAFGDFCEDFCPRARWEF